MGASRSYVVLGEAMGALGVSLGPPREGLAVQPRVGDGPVEVLLRQHFPSVEAVVRHPICPFVGVCRVQDGCLIRRVRRISPETAWRVRQPCARSTPAMNGCLSPGVFLGVSETEVSPARPPRRAKCPPVAPTSRQTRVIRSCGQSSAAAWRPGYRGPCCAGLCRARC